MSFKLPTEGANEPRNNLFFNKVTVIGVGLIGASFALALKKNGLCGTIHGYGRTEDNLVQARQRGIIDAYSLDACKACEDSDLIVLSTPVGLFRDVAEKISNSVKEGALITDVGSVKGALVYELETALQGRGIYAGSHPIAGSDKSGIGDARADLFNTAKCIVTPTSKTNDAATKKIVSIWETFGARVELMDPFRHDEVYAAVSHLPHLVAYAIVNTVNDIDPAYIEYAGKGFRDTTRIALSSPELWRDISMLNRDNLIRLISVFRDNIDRMADCLKENSASKIEDEFSKARALRRKLK